MKTITTIIFLVCVSTLLIAQPIKPDPISNSPLYNFGRPYQAPNNVNYEVTPAKVFVTVKPNIIIPVDTNLKAVLRQLSAMILNGTIPNKANPLNKYTASLNDGGGTSPYVYPLKEMKLSDPDVSDPGILDPKLYGTTDKTIPPITFVPDPKIKDGIPLMIIGGACLFTSGVSFIIAYTGHYRITSIQNTNSVYINGQLVSQQTSENSDRDKILTRQQNKEDLFTNIGIGTVIPGIIIGTIATIKHHKYNVYLRSNGITVKF